MPDNLTTDGPGETGPVFGDHTPGADEYSHTDEPAIHAENDEDKPSRKPLIIVALVATAAIIIAAIAFLVSSGEDEEEGGVLVVEDAPTSQSEEPRAPVEPGDGRRTSCA